MAKWLMIIFISVFAIMLQVLGSDACAATPYGEALDGYPEADFRDAPALPDDRALIVILRPKAAIDGAPFRVEMDGEPVEARTSSPTPCRATCASTSTEPNCTSTPAAATFTTSPWM